MANIQLTRLDPARGVPSANPIFVGPVSIQNIVSAPSAESLTVTAVTFSDGAQNRPHRHTVDQVLVAISGHGFVATDESEQPMEPGDVAFIPRGTRHWHGAGAGQTFTHLSILTNGHTQIDDYQEP